MLNNYEVPTMEQLEDFPYFKQMVKEGKFKLSDLRLFRDNGIARKVSSYDRQTRTCVKENYNCVSGKSKVFVNGDFSQELTDYGRSC